MAQTKKIGPRIPVSWGTATRKVKGRSIKVPLISLVSESVFKLTGLKEYKFANSLKLTQDSKKRTRVAAQGITRSATRYVLIHVGEYSIKSKQKVWHRVPVPNGVSLAKAARQLQGGKKVVEVRWPSTPTGRQARLKNPAKGKGSTR